MKMASSSYCRSLPLVFNTTIDKSPQFFELLNKEMKYLYKKSGKIIIVLLNYFGKLGPKYLKVPKQAKGESIFLSQRI